MPLLHAAALALWAAALVCALLPVPPAAARVVRALHAPAALAALFGAIALFHRHPEQWFTPAGKARAALLVGLLALDAAAQGLARPEAAAVNRLWPRSAGALTLLFALAQISLTWVSPWKT
jgi:hypothetical protein